MTTPGTYNVFRSSLLIGTEKQHLIAANGIRKHPETAKQPSRNITSAIAKHLETTTGNRKQLNRRNGTLLPCKGKKVTRFFDKLRYWYHSIALDETRRLIVIR